MAKLQYKFDTRTVIERMKKFAELKRNKDLARFLNVSSQSVSNYIQEGTIPLKKIMFYIDKTGADIKSILYGKDIYHTPLNLIPGRQEEPLGSYSEKWILKKGASSVSDVRFFFDNYRNYYLVDISAAMRKIKNGIYVLKFGQSFLVRTLRIKDDVFTIIEGEKSPILADKLNVVGRVILACPINWS